MPSSSPDLAEWQALEAHCRTLQNIHMRDLFVNDSKRFEKFHAKIKGLVFDYSRHRANDETLEFLMALARAQGVEEWRGKMFGGEKINITENRPVLHMALRGSTGKTLQVEGENIAAFVEKLMQQVKTISGKIRSDKNITDIVNIGIGGSDLGARMVCDALEDFHDGPRVHFVSNVDGASIASTLKNLKPENTVFIVASKTFTTLETMTNAVTAKDWARSTDRFYAVSSNVKKAEEFGIKPDHILPMRDWIGGRMSLWSGTGLSIAIATGFENFQHLLDGARAMDEHFLRQPLEKNIPVIMAMLGIWYRNFWDLSTYAVLPYAQALSRFPAYLQQLDMESNGKSVSRDGAEISWKTGPIVFGEPGTDAQHAFMQLMHQGMEVIPADFIVVKTPGHRLSDHHRKLNANALSQAQALMEGVKNPPSPHKAFPGNRPSSTLILERLDAWHLGMLLAAYEHKIFVQGIVWNINSFDQWGVELGKAIASTLLDDNAPPPEDFTTRSLLQILEE